MKKWEYRRVYFDVLYKEDGPGKAELNVLGINDKPLEEPLELISYLNEAGHDGWDVVGVIRDNNLLLKRKM